MNIKNIIFVDYFYFFFTVLFSSENFSQWKRIHISRRGKTVINSVIQQVKILPTARVGIFCIAEGRKNSAGENSKKMKSANSLFTWKLYMHACFCLLMSCEKSGARVNKG